MMLHIYNLRQNWSISGNTLKMISNLTLSQTWIVLKCLEMKYVVPIAAIGLVVYVATTIRFTGPYLIGMAH